MVAGTNSPSGVTTFPLTPFPAAVTDTNPIPEHNFLLPLSPLERNPDWFPFIEDFNKVKTRLLGIQANLWGDGGVTELEWLKHMKGVVEGFIPVVMRKFMKWLPLVTCHDADDLLTRDTRDGLVNVGAAFIMCGAHLIMMVMASNTSDDEFATCSNYYIQKAFYGGSEVVCSMCGHRNCNRLKSSNNGWV